MQELPKNWSITMSSVNEINRRHPSVPGVKSPLRHDSVPSLWEELPIVREENIAIREHIGTGFIVEA